MVGPAPGSTPEMMASLFDTFIKYFPKDEMTRTQIAVLGLAFHAGAAAYMAAQNTILKGNYSEDDKFKFLSRIQAEIVEFMKRNPPGSEEIRT